MDSLIELLPRLLQVGGSILIFIVVIAVLVFVHELGHFTAAKWLGVHVKEFAIGFGKSLWSRKFGKTTYKVNLIPLGGYVSLEGEEHTQKATTEKDPQSFQTKPFWAKAIILLAGIFMNIVLAILLMTIYLPLNNYQTQLTYIDLRSEFKFIGAEERKTIAVFVNDVIEGSAADGLLQSGDVLYQVDGAPINGQDEFLAYLSEKNGQEITVDYYKVDLETGQILSTEETTIRLADVEEGNDKPILGVSFGTQTIAYYLEYPKNILSALPHTLNVFNYQLAVLGDSLSRSVEERDVNIIGDQVGSVAAVGAVIDQQVNNSEFDEIINIAALVSLSLAFFNILPLPILDGGQLFIYGIEAVTRRRLPEGFISILNQVTFVLLILLSVVLIFRDFIRFQFLGGIIESLRTVFGA